MKILFISYYFDPFPDVGAKRVSYWADEISKHGIEPIVITAIEQKDKKNYPIYFVPNTKRKRNLSTFIKDEGYTWETDLIDFIDNSNFSNFNFVLISGGPFMHMGITSYLKKRFPKTKVLLDFRDPFGINPRYKEPYFKTFIKKYFERKYCKKADYIITVNDFCKRLMQTNKSVNIIENGFDEREIHISTPSKNNTNFIISHAGSLYQDRDPRMFLDALNDNFNEFEFEQYGNDTDFFNKYRNCSFFNYKGKYAYKELIKHLNKADACILFTLGKAFESTTKIFDYIALNKRILIITEGEPKTGNLHEITKEYPNIIWSKNNTDAIKKSIDELKEMKVQAFDSSSFSRKKSLEQLVTLLKSI